ncbi:unnamed protein product [Vitrella brassicaformis CCMP3155]|uniref:Cilia- and flagella-associated protein 206 n=2 Tax=Vitrella brassicaformis TaxID=1169539 RepID=A0A0G4F4I5_VITBC|nr:unnamed protein product [Vitrella brassicaformis CCMP3155]|eukprot:CEM06710.1 unnamed protein product [Vitrella brassicaformis CCMP3155]
MVLISLSVVTREIVTLCRQLGQAVSEAYAAYVATTLLNPATGTFYVDKPLDEPLARALIEGAVQQIFAKGDPHTEIFRLQATYDSTFLDLQQKLTAYQNTVEDFEANLITNIADSFTESRNASTSEGLEAHATVYKKVYRLLLSRAGHLEPLTFDGTPSGGMHVRHPSPKPKSTGAVEREVAAALESVFPRLGLRAFLSLTPGERATQLGELGNIVLGIRLFNQNLGKGGAGLPVLDDSTWPEEARGFEKELQRELDQTEGVCQDLVEVLLYTKGKEFTVTDEDDKQEADKLVIEPSSRIRQLMYTRQMQAYLGSLLEEVSGAVDALSGSQQEFLQELQELKISVGAKTSVPKELVYPKFDTLARLFRVCLSHRNVVNSRSPLLKLLRAQRRDYFPEVPRGLLDAAAAAKVDMSPAEAFRQQVGKEDALPELPEGTEALETPVRLTMENTPDFMQLPLDFQGFCVWCLVRRSGILVPGNPSLGVVRYKGRFCVVSHEKALEEFLQAPERFFIGIRAVCLAHPQLIHLLRLHEDFPKSSLTTILEKLSEGAAGVSLAQSMQADAATMTPTHFVESHIDRNYEWNEWKLRGTALHYADIMNKTTMSTQTNGSNFRREAETQVWPPRDTSTNTLQNRGTNPPRHHRYLRGLRGHKEDRLKVVDLKFEL